MKLFKLNKVSGWRNINFNKQKRKKGKIEFEKDFYKLLNNTFAGKTIENMRNRLRKEFDEKM